MRNVLAYLAAVAINEKLKRIFCLLFFFVFVCFPEEYICIRTVGIIKFVKYFLNFKVNIKN